MNAAFARIPADIESTTAEIKAALRSGDMGRALLLVSKKIGLKICAGEIAVKLKKQRWT
jgi:hypothetical protein